MTDNIKVGIVVSDNGTTNKVTKNVKDLKGILDQTADSAGRTSKALESATGVGRTTSSGKVARSAAARPTGMAGETAGISGRDVEEYNRARGAAGAAGGSARDFADQARGLGGLVRLYATFAANIFAATAAFGALSRAMDTTNMVKGLDQLGAASGRNLGTLSKQLALASDGAVSLREAMEATTKASSAGLSSKQILELGEGAKKAAQALGLNMTDALSRLSRGISKIEPELLDELGIYVKLEDATEKYARSLGRTASSLTDYERRQAFALAALEQVNKKFGEIQIDVNPYTKLLATFQNLLQSGLELVNKVLSPVIKFLSESPIALAAILAVIAKTLVSQAIPYFGQFRKSLEDQALAANKAVEAAEKQRSAYRAYKEELIGTAVAQKELADRTKAISAVESLQTGARATTKRLATPELVSAAAAEGDIANLTILEKSSSEISKRIKLIEKSKATTDAAKQKNAEELVILKDAKKAIDDKIQSAKEYKNVVEGTVESGKKTGILDTSRAAQIQRTSESAKQTKKSIEVLRDVGDFYDAYGFKASFGELGKQLVENKEKLGFFGTAMTGVKGVGMLLASGIGQILSVFNQFTFVLGVATGLFAALDSVLSTNSKELEEFSSSIETANSNLKLVSDTVTRISKQDLGSSLLPQNIEARANAFVELSGGVEKLVTSFQKLNIASSYWDNFIDRLKAAGVGSARLQEFSKSISKQIVASLNIIDVSEARENVKKQIQNILQIKNVDTESIRKAFNDAGQDAEKLGEKISKILTKGAQTAAADSAKLKEALQGFDAINKSYQDLAISLKDSSPLASFADNLIKGAIQAEQAFSNTKNIVSFFNEILKDTSKLKFLSDDSIRSLKSSEGELKNTISNIETLEKQVKAAEKAQEELNATLGKLTPQQLAQLERYRKDGIETFADRLNQIISTGRKAQIEIDINVESLKVKLQRILNEPFIKGAELVAKEFIKNAAKAQLDITGSLLSKISGPGRAEAEFEIQKQRIELEKTSISAMYDLTVAIERNSFIIKELDILKTLRERAEKLGTAGGIQVKDTEYIKLEEQLKEIQAALGVVNKGLNFTIEDFKELSKQFPNLAKGLSSFFAATMGTRSKLVGQEGQLNIAKIAKDFGREEEKFKIDQTRKKEELDLLNTAKERQSILSNIYGIENTALIVTKQNAVTAAELKSQEIARAEIVERIERTEFVIQKLNELKSNQKGVLSAAEQKTLDAAEQTAKEETKQLAAYDKQIKARNELLRIQNEIEKISSQTAVQQKRIEFDKQIADGLEEVRQISVNAAKQEFDSLVNRGQVSEEYAAKRTAQLAQEAQQIQFNKQLRDLAAQKELDDLQARDKFQKAIAAGQSGVEAEAARDEQLKRNIELYNSRRAVLDANNVSAIRAIELTRQQTLETTLQNEQIKKQAELLGVFQSLADAIGQAFGKAGEAIGKFVGNIGTIIDRQETYNREREKQSGIIKEVSDIEKAGFAANAEQLARREKAQKELNDLDRKNARDELADNATLIGSAKNLFKQKTGAYKALAAVEKVLHVARIAMDLKELATKLFVTKAQTAAAVSGETTQTAAAQTGFFARIGTYITEIFAKITAQIGIPGPAVAAAIIAAIGLGSRGKKVSTVGMTAEDRQKVQGTGQAFVGGKIVETGGGVFGDATAKSQSIANSLEVIKSTSVEGLSFSNKMVTLLEAIKDGITGVAQGVYGVTGIRTGSAFGTQEGTSGRMVLGGLFGGTTSNQIIDTGIAIKGTFGELIKGVTSLIQVYETSVTTTTSSFLWIKKTSQQLNEQFKALDEVAPGVGKQITSIFANAAGLFVEAGGKLGMTAEAVTNALNSIPVDKLISLKDLKGEELEKELSAVLSSILDTTASQLFQSLDKFKKFGEGMLETVIRVVDQTEKVNLALKSLGKEALNTGKVLTQTSIEIADELVKAAGSLEKFIDQTKFFADNFLSESERLIPVQKAVTDELARLKLGSIDTIQEFKTLVQALDLTQEYDRQLYQSLMNLAPAFVQVYKETSKLLSLEEFRSKVYDQETKVLQLLGKNQELLNRTREKEIEELKKYDKAQSDVLIANQKYIYALEDEAKARDVLKERLDDTVGGLKSAIDNLTNYRKQLLLSDKTTLTPIEQYKEAQKEFEKLRSIATGTAVSEKDKQLQLEAINKLPQAADTFLNLSRTMYASGGQYMTDFKGVLDTLDQVGVSTQAQLTDAEKQLEELKKSSYYLEEIQQSSKDTNTLLQEWRDAATAAAALGPQDPNAILPNTAPLSINNQQIIDELKNLRDEFKKQLEALRNEQSAQTTATINNNTQNADTVATRVVDAIDEKFETEWNDRLAMNP